MQDIIKNVKFNGVAKKDNWLNSLEKEKAIKIIKSASIKNVNGSNNYSVRSKSFFIKFMKLDLKKILASIFFIKLAKKLKLFRTFLFLLH